MTFNSENSRLSPLGSTDASAAVSCVVQSERLHELMPNLVPLLSREPIAVDGPNGERFYLVDARQMASWQAANAPTRAGLRQGPLVLTVEALADRLMEAEYQRVRNGEFSLSLAKQ